MMVPSPRWGRKRTTKDVKSPGCDHTISVPTNGLLGVNLRKGLSEWTTTLYNSQKSVCRVLEKIFCSKIYPSFQNIIP